MTDTKPTIEWAIDRRIAIGGILAIVVQAAGLIWYAATGHERLKITESNLVAVQMKFAEHQLKVGHEGMVTRSEELIRMQGYFVDELRAMNMTLRKFLKQQQGSDS